MRLSVTSLWPGHRKVTLKSVSRLEQYQWRSVFESLIKDTPRDINFGHMKCSVTAILQRAWNTGKRSRREKAQEDSLSSL